MQFLTSLDLGSRVGVVVKGKREALWGRPSALSTLGCSAAARTRPCGLALRLRHQTRRARAGTIGTIGTIGNRSRAYRTAWTGSQRLKEGPHSDRTRPHPGQSNAPSNQLPAVSAGCAPAPATECGGGSVTHLYGLKGPLLPKGVQAL